MKRNIELLPQVSFSILMALSLKPRHGYEIIQQVEEDSGGKVRLGPGALYTTIQKMLENGLIEELEQSENERRRYYQLSSAGWQRLGEELEYYQQIVKLSNTRLAPKWGNQ